MASGYSPATPVPKTDVNINVGWGAASSGTWGAAAPQIRIEVKEEPVKKDPPVKVKSLWGDDALKAYNQAM